MLSYKTTANGQGQPSALPFDPTLVMASLRTFGIMRTSPGPLMTIAFSMHMHASSQGY